MGQEEVYEFLKEHSERWITSNEIYENLDISRGPITTSLKKLLRNGEIKKRRDPFVRYGYLYRLKE